MIKAAGSYLYEVKKFLIKKYGEEKYLELLETLIPESKEIFSKPIMSSEWYKLSTYQDLLEAISLQYGKQELGIVSEDIARDQIGSFFGFIARFLTVDRIFKDSQRMWDKAFSEGKLELIKSENNHYELKLSEFKFNEEPLYSKKVKDCVYSVEMYMKAILEVIQGKPSEKTSSLIIDETTTVFKYDF